MLERAFRAWTVVVVLLLLLSTDQVSEHQFMSPNPTWARRSCSLLEDLFPREKHRSFLMRHPPPPTQTFHSARNGPAEARVTPSARLRGLPPEHNTPRGSVRGGGWGARHGDQKLFPTERAHALAVEGGPDRHGSRCERFVVPAFVFVFLARRAQSANDLRWLVSRGLGLRSRRRRRGGAGYPPAGKGSRALPLPDGKLS